VKKYVLNKRGKFGVKIFLWYTDIMIVALGYFILHHPLVVIIVFFNVDNV